MLVDSAICSLSPSDCGLTAHHVTVSHVSTSHTPTFVCSHSLARSTSFLCHTSSISVNHVRRYQPTRTDTSRLKPNSITLSRSEAGRTPVADVLARC